MRYLLQEIQVGPALILRLPWLLKLLFVVRLCKDSAQELPNTGKAEGSFHSRADTCNYNLPLETWLMFTEGVCWESGFLAMLAVSSP